MVLGQFGYQVLCGVLGVRPRPKFGHGVEVPLPLPDPPGAAGAVDGPWARTLLCSYHVSQQNTFTGKLTETMLDDVFRRARELAGEAPFHRR